MGFLFAGDFLGIANSQDYICSAEAITDIKLCKFRRIDLENLFNDFPKMKTHLLGIAQNEFAEVQEQMMLLGRKKSLERVASFLLTLSDRATIRGEPDNPVYVPMGQGDVGDYLGLTTETVSRSMSRLKRQKLILKKDALQRITILDKAGLTHLAGGYRGA